LNLGYRVVILPDTEAPSLYHPIPSSLIYNEFIYNVELRAALYQLSKCNLGVANGPLGLSHFNPLVNSTIMLKLSPKGSDNAAEYEATGVDPETPYFWYNKLTINSCLDDTFVNIKALFHQVIPQQGA
jgi:hypothetical protein